MLVAGFGPFVTLVAVGRALSLEKLVESSGVNHVALLRAEVGIFEIEVKLRGGEHVLAAGDAQLNSVAEPGLEGIAQLVSVEADKLSLRTTDAAGEAAAVAEVNRHDTVRLARHDPKGRDNLLAVLVRDLDDGNVMLAAFDRAAVVGNARDCPGGVRTENGDVVPGNFRKWSR